MHEHKEAINEKNDIPYPCKYNENANEQSKIFPI